MNSPRADPARRGVGHNRGVSLAAAPPRILVADDDLTVSEVVTRYLEREGFVVEVAYEGAVALDRAQPRRLCMVWGVGYRFEP